MDVGVADALARRAAVVGADVEAVGPRTLGKRLALIAQELEAGADLLAGEIEKARAVPLRDDEGVSLRDRLQIADGDGEGVGRDHPRPEITERTAHAAGTI